MCLSWDWMKSRHAERRLTKPHNSVIKQNTITRQKTLHLAIKLSEDSGSGILTAVSLRVVGLTWSLIIKTWDPFLLATVCSLLCWESLLKWCIIKFPSCNRPTMEAIDSITRYPIGKGRGASSVGLTSAARVSPAWFCLLAWRQRGQTIDPWLLATTIILLRQSWQKTCLQLRVRFCSQNIFKAYRTLLWGLVSVFHCKRHYSVIELVGYSVLLTARGILSF